MLSSVGRRECGGWGGAMEGETAWKNKSYSGGKTLLSESFSTSPRGREGGEESVDVCLSVCVCVCVWRKKRNTESEAGAVLCNRK